MPEGRQVVTASCVAWYQLSVAVSALLSSTPFSLQGPLRKPVQMLAEQMYGGHESLHDSQMAASLGFDGAPIEGPTHFSQFEPLLAALWGRHWFSHGCMSAHFEAVVVEGEEVRACVKGDGPGCRAVAVRAAKADGTPVLTGTASTDEGTSARALSSRLDSARGRPPDRLHILDQLSVGQRGARRDETVVVEFDRPNGDLYPFSLSEKLQKMTEVLRWHEPDGGQESPWGAAVVPMEMVSVLAHRGSADAGFDVRQPSVALFIDLEIELLGTPVLVGREYRVEREIVALSESRRTESYWTATSLVETESGLPTARVLLHQGVLKESYPGYPTAG